MNEVPLYSYCSPSAHPVGRLLRISYRRAPIPNPQWTLKILSSLLGINRRHLDPTFIQKFILNLQMDRAGLGVFSRELSTLPFFLRMLGYRVPYDSGKVSLEHLLLSRNPSPTNPESITPFWHFHPFRCQGVGSRGWGFGTRLTANAF